VPLAAEVEEQLELGDLGETEDHHEGSLRLRLGLFQLAVTSQQLQRTPTTIVVILTSIAARKHGSCLEEEIMQGTIPGARGRGRPPTAWMDNIKTWTGLPVEESIRMTEDSDKWRKYVHGAANPRIEDG